jgi:hypothetical protein
MTDDSYDYDANCRRWPDVAGPFPVGTVDFEVTDPIRSSRYAPEPTVTGHSWESGGIGYPNDDAGRSYTRICLRRRPDEGCSRREATVHTDGPNPGISGLLSRANGIRGNNGTRSAFADCRPASRRSEASIHRRTGFGGMHG